MENNTAHLEVSQQFECSKEKLFAAWTRPEELKQWWRPMERQLTSVTNELKEGGEVKYVFEDGSLAIDGRYKNVVDNELLVYTWNWHVSEPAVEDAAYKLTVKFAGDVNTSTLTITQEGLESSEHLQPHRQGWEQGLQQLQNYIGGHAGSGESAGGNDGEQKPPVTGYNETPEQEKVGGA